MFILIYNYHFSFAGAEPDEIINTNSISYHNTFEEAKREAEKILSLNNKEDYDEYYSIIGIFDTNKNLYKFL